MKRFFTAVLALLMVFTLTSVAWAANGDISAHWREVEGDYSDTDIIKVITDITEEIIIIIEPDERDGIYEGSEINRDTAAGDAEEGGTVIVRNGDSIEVHYYKNGQKIELGDGNTLVTMKIPEEYVGKGYYLYVYYIPTDGDTHAEEGQESEVNDCILLDSDEVTIRVTKSGIYTVVIMKDKLPGRLSPQTWQTPVPALLLVTAIMSAATAVYAGKRKHE